MVQFFVAIAFVSGLDFESVFLSCGAAGNASFARLARNQEAKLRASGDKGAWLVTTTTGNDCLATVREAALAHGLVRSRDEYAVQMWATWDEARACGEATAVPPEFKIDDGVFDAPDGWELSIDLAFETDIELLRGLDAEGGRRIVVRGAADLASLAVRVARAPGVMRVGAQPPHLTLNYEARWIVQSDDARAESTPLYDRDGLHGEDIVIGCADSGLDYLSCFFYDDAVPVSFVNGRFESTTHRKVRQYVAFADAAEGEDEGHGTHVAGTIAGHAEGQDIANIDVFYVNDGMAPLAKLAFYDIGVPGEEFLRVPAAIDQTLFADAYSVGARIHSNSWGADINSYLSNDQSVDSFSWQNQDFLVFVAAGNAGPDPGTLGSPAASKNAIAVGATDNVQSTFTGIDDDGTDGADVDVSGFSSRGPAFDGRLKPDLVAPGDSVISAASLATPSPDHCFASRLSGTSMATPVLSGTAGLVQQYFQEGFYPTGLRTTQCQSTCFSQSCDFWSAPLGVACSELRDAYGCRCCDCESSNDDSFTPMGTLLKALLIASARYVPGPEANRHGTSFPNHDQGFGMVVVDNALNPYETSLFVLGDFDNMPSLGSTSEGSVFSFEIAPDGDGSTLVAALVWHDPPSAQGATTTLINDLDILVSHEASGSNFFPNGANSRDDVNNVERVVVENVVAGERYDVYVGATVMSAAFSPQPFSLVVTGKFLKTSDLYPSHAAVVASASRGGPDATWLVVRGSGFTVGTGGASMANASVWKSVVATCADDAAALGAASFVGATDAVFAVDLGSQAATCSSVSLTAVNDKHWHLSVESVAASADGGVAAAAACWGISDLNLCAAIDLCQLSEPSTLNDGIVFVSCEPSDAEEERIDVSGGTNAGSGSKKKSTSDDAGVLVAAIVVPLVVGILLACCIFALWKKRTSLKRGSSLRKASAMRVPQVTSTTAMRPSAPPSASHSQLPAGWEVYHDDDSGNVFYVNSELQLSTWDRPAPAT